MSARDELILMFDPFDGDFGSQGDKVLSDKMVTGRKPHTCTHCDGPISIGERHRSRSERIDGNLMAHRWCAACCDLMARSVEGDCDADEIYEERLGARASHGAGVSG
jgi:hypothetical protein